jgi:autotransporter-associated beta strand protein
LNGFTLTKVGSSQFTLVAATVSAGNIVVSAVPGQALQSVMGIETISSVPAATNPDNSPSTITFNDNTALEVFQLTGTVTRQMIMNGNVLLENGNATVLSTLGSPITLNGVLTMNTSLSNTNGPITLTGAISGPGSIVKANNNASAVLTLSGANTYTGNTTVTGGVLQIGAANSVPAASNLVLGGGTFNSGGLSDTMNKLTVQAASIMDLAAGASTLNFNNSSLTPWIGGLTINNWSSGTDHIFVGPSSLTGPGLTHAQLNSIQFTGAGTGAILQGGELLPNTGAPLLTIVPGDFNLDGQVTAADLPAMLSALTDLNSYESTKQISDGDLLTLGDFNHSGSVTNVDIQGMLDYLASLGAGSVAGVPEPASIVLLGMGALALLRTAARRRSATPRFRSPLV